MPRPTERVTIKANHHPEYSGFNKCLYSVPNDRVQVHEFRVPGVEAIDVGVTRLQGSASLDGENFLKKPIVALHYINQILSWFDWTGFSRRGGLIYIVLDQPRELMIDVTREKPTDFAMQAVDEAYTWWRRNNPLASDQEYLDLTAKRIADGKITCIYSDCFEVALPQDCVCVKHQDNRPVGSF